MAAPLVFGRFTVTGILGSGPRGRVLEVADLGVEEKRTLKVLLDDSGSAPVFVNFDAYKVVSHPNIMPLIDCGTDPTGLSYLVYTALPGRTLNEMSLSTTSLREGVHYFRQALMGLKALHDAGLAHGNLKGSNCLICADTGRLGRLCLLDGGLNPPISPDPKGRIPIAPECLAGAEVGIQSDLYSLGVVFYEALTGASPFTATGGMALAAEKREGRIKKPSQVRLQVPSTLDSLFLSLLDPDPNHRPGSVEEVLRTLDGVDDEPVTSSIRNGKFILPLVGRDAALKTMDEVIDRVLAGNGQVLMVCGDTGTGKSRILQELRLRLRKKSMAVLSTRGRGRDRPLGPMRRLISPALEEFGAIDDLGEYAPAIYPYWPKLKSQVFRPLGTLDIRGRGTSFPLAQADRLASFFLEGLSQPRALLVDDAHAAAADLERLLVQLSKRLSEVPFLVVVALDPRRLPSGSTLLRRLEGAGAIRVDLKALDTGHVSSLLQRAFGEIEGAGALHRAVFDWSEGFPNRIDFYLKRLFDYSVLRGRRGNWRFERSRLSLASASLPTGTVSLEFALLYGVDEDSLSLLRAIAVLGPCRTREIGAALHPRQNERELEADLLRLSHMGLLRGRGREPRYDLVYESQRGHLARDVDLAKQRQWHRRLAEYWSEKQSRSPESQRFQAKNWQKCGEDLRALGPGIVYLDYLKKYWRFETALDWVRWLLKLKGMSLEKSFELREVGTRLALRLGDIEAAKELGGRFGDVAFGLADSSMEWRSEWLRGLICLRGSAYEEARTHLEAACAWIPDFALEVDRADLMMAAVLARMLTGRPEMAERLAEETLARFSTKKQVQIQQNVISIWALRSNLAWIRGRSEQAESLALKGATAARTFLYNQPEAKNSLNGELGHLNFMLSNACYYQGRYGDAIQSALVAAGHFELSGDLAFLGRCYHLAGLSHMMMGAHSEAISQFEKLREVAGRSEAEADKAQALFQLGSLYRVAGQLEWAIETLEEGRFLARRLNERRLIGQIEGSLGEAWHNQGDLKKARWHYERAVEILQYSSKRDLLENIRRLLELAYDEGNLHGFEAGVAEALTLARSQGQGLEEGNLLSLLGVYAARMGRTREAFDHFAEGERALREVGAFYALGRLKLRQGQAYLDMGAASDAERALSGAAETFRKLGAIRALGSVQGALEKLEEKNRGGTQAYKKLQMLLDVNRSLNAMRDLSKLLDLVVDKAIELTGAERGFVLLFNADGSRARHSARHMRPEEIEGGDDLVSQTVLNRVREGMGPVMVTNVDRDSALRGQKSVVALGLRAIMAAPLKRGDSLLGILYLDSSSPIDEFYHRDQSLIEALADAAAIAVENAQLLRSLERKNERMSILAHEFRSPVTATMLFVRQMLRRQTKMEPGDRTALEGIATQSDRLGRMIDNILQLSQMEAQAVVWEMSPVDVEDIALGVVAELKPLAQERGITLTCLPGRGKLLTWGNSDRLIQVCTNLLANAIKVSKDGFEIIVCVSRREGLASGQGGKEKRPFKKALESGFVPASDAHIIVEVLDSGPGLPEAVLSEIFERYVQAGDNVSRARGNGLGLFIAKGIVEEHGGRIWAENRQGVVWEGVLPDDVPTIRFNQEELAKLVAEADRKESLEVENQPFQKEVMIGAAFRFTLPLLLRSG